MYELICSPSDSFKPVFTSYKHSVRTLGGTKGGTHRPLVLPLYVSKKSLFFTMLSTYSWIALLCKAVKEMQSLYPVVLGNASVQSLLLIGFCF